MPKKQAAELREMHDEALAVRLAEEKQTLFNLRFQNATGELDNHSRFQEVRRNIARIHTIMRAREIEAHEALMKESSDG
jgi:large subunit ribosomal protein L29